MIVGFGTDLAEVALFQKECLSSASPFLRETFTEEERAQAGASTAPTGVSLAGRFAAKEACVKALGSAFQDGKLEYGFRDIEVLVASHGAPSVMLHGSLDLVARALGVSHIWCSISHDGAYAVASVILEKQDK